MACYNCGTAKVRANANETSHLTPVNNNTFDIGRMSKSSLRNLLESAYPEAVQVYTMFNIITDLRKELNNIQAAISFGRIGFRVGIIVAPICALLGFASPLFWLVAIAGAIFAFVSGLIYLCHKNGIEKAQADYSREQKRAEQIAQGCIALPYIPIEYRMPFAIETMIKYLRNGQADNWRECSLLCDQQIRHAELIIYAESVTSYLREIASYLWWL